ncbi:hypothetical protein BDQ17DRAFT_1350572 [Cyathus striatus]|nr:hypothetical protein BDQ17DRAFT_1350572 [Cyathus striatus]
MKDSLPLPTPFYQAHGAVTPGSLSERRSHYFDQRTPTTSALQCDVEISISLQHLDTSSLQHKHNEVQSSILDQVPNEVLSVIIEHGYFDRDDTEEPDSTFRSTLSKTSRRLRNVALHTHSIWSVFHLSQGNIIPLLQAIPVYLARSKDYPLDIRMNCFWSPELTDTIMNLFIPHSRRWRHLSITTPNTNILSSIKNTPVPLLRSFKISQFSSRRSVAIDVPLFDNGIVPELSYLVLRNVSLSGSLPLRNLRTLEIRGYGVWPAYEELNHILGGSESLQKLVVHVKPGDVLRNVDRQDRDPIPLPALHTFEVLTSEWLSRDIASLIRLFACPQLKSLTVQDTAGCSTSHGRPILELSGKSKSAIVARRPRSEGVTKLSVWASSAFTAWSALSPSTQLHTLELRSATWPDYTDLHLMCMGLRSLETLITEIDPSYVLREVSPEGRDGTLLPSLRTLEVSVTRHIDSERKDDDLTRFIKLFSVPSLESLKLRNLTDNEWSVILKHFAAHIHEYSRLASLTVRDMPYSFARKCPSPVEAFPRLRHLALHRASSNDFIKHLLVNEEPSARGLMPVWPQLKSLTITGDENVSRPLVHCVIVARKAMGMPIEKMCVDEVFLRNGESWEWLNAQAKVGLVKDVDVE